MNFFLLNFFLIYGSAHLYFYWRVNKAFSLSLPPKVLLTMFLVAMVIAPLAVRLLERDGKTSAATSAAMLGYNWMGFLFLFISIALVLELFRFAHSFGHLFFRLNKPALFQPAPFLIFCLLLAGAISVYGRFEATNLKVEHHLIRSDRLPAGSPSIRIVQISDLHIGLLVQEKQVRRVVETIKNSKPDLLVATGDIVDGHVSHLDGIAELFKGLNPGLGMIAIPGNHEYYAGLGSARRFLEQSGFRFLRSEGIPAGERLWVVGVDDPMGKRSGDFHPEEESKMLAAAPKDRFVLLLKHRPVVEPGSVNQFGLQLSGHVHKGQIFPFNLLTWISFPIRAGLTKLSKDSSIYVSRGTGTWGPPIRFLAPPEVSVFDIMPGTD
jgi:predicted MPP superfamily phosphohydrolase